MFRKIINWLRGLLIMNEYTFTDANGVQWTFKTSTTLPEGLGTLACNGGATTNGGGGPGSTED